MPPSIGLDILLFPLSCVLTVTFQHVRSMRQQVQQLGLDAELHVHAYSSLVGNTPMVELRKLSALLGRRILVKMESMNPGTEIYFFSYSI